MLKIDISDIYDLAPEESILALEEKVTECNNALYSKSGKGSDFLGWLDLPSRFPADEIVKIKYTAAGLAENSDIIVVIGIGGSYLGARAVIDALSYNFSSILTKDERKAPLILYAGQNISESYHKELLEILDKNDYSIIVISKSGTTTEPAIAFRLLKEHIENKYGKEDAKKRIAAVTDSSRGALKKVADIEGYTSFIIPDDVGGRFSVLTPVGLLPIAAAGFDIDKLLAGAKDMEELCRNEKHIQKNPADLYAAARYLLHTNGKSLEILAGFEPNLNYIIEWWKQLYGESEGKDGKGIFPAGVNFTTDLHSMGQYLQDGVRFIFETVLTVASASKELRVPETTDNIDEMNFVAGKRLGEINKMAELGTRIAHIEGGVPNISISIDKLDEYELGGLIYFFEKACAISGYLLGVNPFDQPGVEAYKKNMFALLGKPGYEELKKTLEEKLKQ